MSISAPGSPQVRRAQDPNDYAGKIVRLRDDGTIPSDNPFVERVGYSRHLHDGASQRTRPRREPGDR